MRIFSVFFLLFITAAVHAGNERGNGGDGVVIDNQVYLFDLYENYVHLSPVLETIMPDKSKLQHLDDHLITIKSQITQNRQDELTNYTYKALIEEFTKKITAIESKNYILNPRVNS